MRTVSVLQDERGPFHDSGTFCFVSVSPEAATAATRKPLRHLHKFLGSEFHPAVRAFLCDVLKGLHNLRERQVHDLGARFITKKHKIR